MKDEALQILANMIYGETEAEYLEQYEKLKEIASTSLLQYFDDNWHNGEIRAMWAGYHISKLSHYKNRTNNRTESFNHKLKSVLTAYAPLNRFFKDTLLVMATLEDEREYRTITRNEKRPT